MKIFRKAEAQWQRDLLFAPVAVNNAPFFTLAEHHRLNDVLEPNPSHPSGLALMVLT